MRNATLMAVAPNANSGLVAGTTPGIDPRFAQVFSRNKISGKYLDINHNLVNDLKNMGLWEKVKDMIIAEQGDLTNISGIPQHVKDIYKTSFSTSPYAFIEVAARAQKWIDQGLSRNMYLETRDIAETMAIYTTAWEKGVKTTYYLHMKPRHTAEQSTVHVNKAEKMGKRGFAAIMEAATTASTEATPAAAMIPPAQPMKVETVAKATAPVIAQQAVASVMPTPKATPAIAEKKSSPTSASPAHDHASAGEHSHNENAAAAEKPKYKIMAPSDPAEANLCDSCQ